MVGDEAVRRAVEHEVPEALHQRAVAQRGRAHAVGAETYEIVEVEQQVMRADLHRHRPPGALLLAHERRADGARDVHDLDPHAGVRCEVQRAVHRLLLDERRAGLVMGHRVDAAGGPHPRNACLQERVALGVHEHEPAHGLHLAHAVEELGVGHVGVRGIRDRHERLERSRALGPLTCDLGNRRRR